MFVVPYVWGIRSRMVEIELVMDNYLRQYNLLYKISCSVVDKENASLECLTVWVNWEE